VFIATAIFAALGISAAQHVQPHEAMMVDDFESGALAGWTRKSFGQGSWFVYDNGKVSPDPDNSDRTFVFNVPDPPQGKFAAVTDMNGPGAMIIYRDRHLGGAYKLHFTVFYVNGSGGPRAFFSSPDTLDRTTEANQQYRIDLLDPLARVDSLAKEDVLLNVFRTSPGDPNRLEPHALTVDLTSLRDRTVRLRLLAVSNRVPLRAGVDDIRLELIGR